MKRKGKIVKATFCPELSYECFLGKFGGTLYAYLLEGKIKEF